MVIVTRRPYYRIMTTWESKSEWYILMGNLKQEWAELTYDDLLNYEGNQDALINRIQDRTGVSREAIEAAISKYRSALADANRHRRHRSYSQFRRKP